MLNSSSEKLSPASAQTMCENALSTSMRSSASLTKRGAITFASF